MLHCMQMGKLQSNKLYKKESQENQSRFHLSMDMVNLVHARNAQSLASGLGYKKMFHSYTMLPNDMKTQLAKKAYNQQSEVSRQIVFAHRYICCKWGGRFAYTGT